MYLDLFHLSIQPMLYIYEQTNLPSIYMELMHYTIKLSMKSTMHICNPSPSTTNISQFTKWRMSQAPETHLNQNFITKPFKEYELMV